MFIAKILHFFSYTLPYSPLFSNLFIPLTPNLQHTHGFYKRESENDNSFLNGRVFVVDRSTSFSEDTFQHEYLHFLTQNYIEPNEIAVFPTGVADIDQKLKEKGEEKNELEEEMEYLDDYDEILDIQDEIEYINQQVNILKHKKRELYDESSQFFSEEASRLFFDMRDELTAYAIVGRIFLDEIKLIPSQKSWQARLEGISYRPDKEKLQQQWNFCKKVLSDARARGLGVEDMLPIFLTSQNFDEIGKRIILLQKSRVNTTLQAA